VNPNISPHKGYASFGNGFKAVFTVLFSSPVWSSKLKKVLQRGIVFDWDRGVWHTMPECNITANTATGCSVCLRVVNCIIQEKTGVGMSTCISQKVRCIDWPNLIPIGNLKMNLPWSLKLLLSLLLSSVSLSLSLSLCLSVSLSLFFFFSLSHS
jgi:hypothetical protein